MLSRLISQSLVSSVLSYISVGNILNIQDFEAKDKMVKKLNGQPKLDLTSRKSRRGLGVEILTQLFNCNWLPEISYFTFGTKNKHRVCKYCSPISAQTYWPLNNKFEEMVSWDAHYHLVVCRIQLGSGYWKCFKSSSSLNAKTVLQFLLSFTFVSFLLHQELKELTLFVHLFVQFKLV